MTICSVKAACIMTDAWAQSQRTIGDYHLLKRLGKGTFGTVYLAEHKHEHTQVAVKVLHMSLTQSEHLKSFLNEVRSMRLSHPHILPLLDFGISQEDSPFLVMEYIPKGTLRDCFPKGTRLPLSQVVAYTQQVASALQCAHDRHLIHRDVKPDNLLLRDNETILLADFGITIGTPSTTFSSLLEGGTPAYMAPEQIQGRPHPASDQYALGVVVYEWLVGERPFKGTLPELITQHLFTPPPSLCKQVPILRPEIEEVVLKALAKNPKERFSSIQAFAAALQQASDLTLSQTFVSIPPRRQSTERVTAKDCSSAVHPSQNIPRVLISSSRRPNLNVLSLPPLPFSPQCEILTSPERNMPEPLFIDMKLSSASPKSPYHEQPAHKVNLPKGRMALLMILILSLIGASYTCSRMGLFTIPKQATTAAMLQYAASTMATPTVSPGCDDAQDTFDKTLCTKHAETLLNITKTYSTKAFGTHEVTFVRAYADRYQLMLIYTTKDPPTSDVIDFTSLTIQQGSTLASGGCGGAGSLSYSDPETNQTYSVIFFDTLSVPAGTKALHIQAIVDSFSGISTPLSFTVPFYANVQSC